MCPWPQPIRFYMTSISELRAGWHSDHTATAGQSARCGECQSARCRDIKGFGLGLPSTLGLFASKDATETSSKQGSQEGGQQGQSRTKRREEAKEEEEGELQHLHL